MVIFPQFIIYSEYLDVYSSCTYTTCKGFKNINICIKRMHRDYKGKHSKLRHCKSIVIILFDRNMIRFSDCLVL